jgi:hypothetical protein
MLPADVLIAFLIECKLKKERVGKIIWNEDNKNCRKTDIFFRKYGKFNNVCASEVQHQLDYKDFENF